MEDAREKIRSQEKRRKEVRESFTKLEDAFNNASEEGYKDRETALADLGFTEGDGTISFLRNYWEKDLGNMKSYVHDGGIFNVYTGPGDLSAMSVLGEMYFELDKRVVYAYEKLLKSIKRS